jgi:hypothetical protein
MYAHLKRGLTIAAIGASFSLLTGCLIETVTGKLTQVSGGYVATVAASAHFGGCEPLTAAGAGHFNCTWTLSDGTSHSYEIVLLGAGEDVTLVDPLVIEVPDTATGLSGTYDNGHGLSGPLLVTTGLKSVPIDANATLVAEVGRQLAIVELPPGTPAGGYAYTFNLTSNNPVVKALFAGKVQVGGKTYYPPLLPCVTSFASVPAFVFTGSAPAPLLTPAYLAQIHACDRKVYTFPSGGPPPSANYQGLFWNAPATSESGWGLNIAHQGDSIFATWFTYDATGKQWWLSMTATKSGSAPDTFIGQIIETRGPAFSASPFDPHSVTRNVVGTGTLSFSDTNTGSFAYTVNGIQQTKALTRQVFGPAPTCTFGTQPNLALATNYQDLWWVALGAESGWGLNLTHQGSNIFATWFTYDTDGTPLWLSATLQQGTGNAYSGALIRTAGPAFNAVPFDPTKVTRTTVGNVTLTFTDGNNARFDYTVNGITQTKTITRQVFVSPGTVCI